MLEKLPAEQLDLFLFTIEGIQRQLEDLSPGLLPEEDKKLHETLSQQAYVLQNTLILERVRRSMAKLQAQLATE